MKTLADIIIDSKCRKGGADGITSAGAYWLCPQSKIAGNRGVKTLIRSYGGDGIGQSCADRRHYLELRHYRGGKVSAVVVATSWHQNSGTQETETEINSVLVSTSTEELESALLALEDGNYGPVYVKYCSEKLAALAELIGLPDSGPSPDDAEVVA
jgi:hypothetical protein